MDLIGEERGRLARAATWLQASRAELVGLVVLLVGALLLTVLVVSSALGRPETLPGATAGPGSTAGEAGVGADHDQDHHDHHGSAEVAHDDHGAGGSGGAGGAAPAAEDGHGPASDGAVVEDGEVTVHVSGAVATPGVVTLPAGSRVADAVTAAGGHDPDAELAHVNLARPLTDGEQVHVPREGEPPPPSVAPEVTGPVDGGAVDVPGAPGTGGPVDLNRASTTELETLPGIGPAIAQRIVQHRETHGPFATVGDLRDVSGIGEKRFQELAPLVTVG
ncbi:ComEA family DNA-binding protein [Nitriliruptoraceae bacterium ZYF776]|nr:ComEA family DNA-binding protein [Profundirhabdus halotolerans]